MGSIRFYLDEHVARAIARGLRQRGVDVLTVVEATKLGAKDAEHLAFALQENRVLFTQDDDFLHLAAAGAPHAHRTLASSMLRRARLSAPSSGDSCSSTRCSKQRRCRAT